MSAPTPARWPASIEFITTPRYHESVPATTRGMLTTGGGTPPRSAGSVSRLVQIRRVTDRGHPACGQHGLFAARKIPPRSHIIDYVGLVHCDDRPDSDYDLSLCRTQDGVSVGIDASAMGNESRFVNDYRGVRDRPNAEFVEHRTAWGELRMAVWSTGEGVRRGDEIVLSYGKSWWRCRGDRFTSNA